MISRSLLIGLLKYALGFGLLVFVIWRSWGDQPNPGGEPLPGLGTILRQPPNWLLIPAAAGLMATIISLQIARWYLLVRAVDLPFTKRNAVRLGLVGYFYNSFLPGAIGGDLVKAYFLARDHPARRPVAVATVVIDRLLGLFGLVLLASTVGGIAWATGAEFIAGNEYLKTIIRTTGITAGVIALGWLLLGWLPERRKNRFEERLHRLKPRKLGQTLAELWFAARTYRRRARVIYISILISIASHLCMVLNFHVCARIFPLVDPASLAEHAVIAPIGYIGQAFFPVPGGVGGAEAIFGFLYTRLDRPMSTGVAARLTLRGFEYAIGLIGYLVFLNTKRELVLPDGEPVTPPGEPSAPRTG